MSMDTPVNVRLREGDLLDRGRQLAEMIERRSRMVDEKKQASREAQDEIDALDDEIAKAAAVLRDGFETRRQGDLFVDQMPPTDRPTASDVATPTVDEATRALAGVAAAAEPKPSDPHVFVRAKTPSGQDLEACEFCGAPEADPVHHGGEPTMLRHVYSPDPEAAIADGAPCKFQDCGLGPDDPIHDMHAQDAPTVDAVPDQVNVPQCAACEQRTCRVHPHAFNDPEDTGRCMCGYVRRAKVHRVEPSQDAHVVGVGISPEEHAEEAERDAACGERSAEERQADDERWEAEAQQ